MYIFSKTSFLTAYVTGKLTQRKPELSKLELIHLNKKSTLLQDFGNFCRQIGLRTINFSNKKLIKTHAYEVEFSPQIVPKVARIAFQGDILRTVEDKKQEVKQTTDLSYKAVIGTDKQAFFSL